MRSEPLEGNQLRQAIEHLLHKEDTYLKKETTNYSLKRSEEESDIAEVEASGSRYFSLVRNPDTLKRLEKRRIHHHVSSCTNWAGWEIISSYGRDYWQGMGARNCFGEMGAGRRTPRDGAANSWSKRRRQEHIQTE